MSGDFTNLGMSAWRIARLLVLLLAVHAPATLASLQVIVVEASPTPAYLGSPTQAWNIAGADIAAGIAVPDFGPSLFIAPVLPGSLTWTGNSLNSDTSIGGLASATFNGGGLLQISGELYDEEFNLLFSGLLFEGEVQGFSVQETSSASNLLEFSVLPVVTPTSNPTAYLNANGLLEDEYLANIEPVGASQGGEAITDFQDDVQFTSNYQLSLVVPVPEPCTGAILLMGSIALLRRRRSGVCGKPLGCRREILG